MSEREEVNLRKTTAHIRNLVDENNIPVQGLEKVVHFEDEAGNEIIYPWELLKKTVFEWIEVEKNE